jgi:hypothetical protein
MTPAEQLLALNPMNRQQQQQVPAFGPQINTANFSPQMMQRFGATTDQLNAYAQQQAEQQPQQGMDMQRFMELMQQYQNRGTNG